LAIPVKRTVERKLHPLIKQLIIFAFSAIRGQFTMLFHGNCTEMKRVLICLYKIGMFVIIC
jgi:hypothetical protein